MSNPASSDVQSRLAPYYKIIESELTRFRFKSEIPLFYDPIQYFLNIPGKRIRPLLVLLAAEASGIPAQQARFAATAVELLHNFTLVHDDIMDNDDTRRGQSTVHQKWDVSTAILAGDGLMGLAFQMLLRSPVGNVKTMMERFTDTMIVICEGQGLDKMFEGKSIVSSEEYTKMISAKTAVLLQLSAELGAMCAQADKKTYQAFRTFGYELGMGFQIQDDLIDIIGESDTIGKPAGSDLSMHKQTAVTIKLQEQFPDEAIYELSLETVRKMIVDNGIMAEIEQRYSHHFDNALNALKVLPDTPARQLISDLTHFIQKREW